jgi:hypothetical protein
MTGKPLQWLRVFVLTITALAAMAGGAHAAYPPGAPIVALDMDIFMFDQPFFVNVFRCPPGGAVTIDFAGSMSSTTADGSGQARTELMVPPRPGIEDPEFVTFRGTARCGGISVGFKVDAASVMTGPANPPTVALSNASPAPGGSFVVSIGNCPSHLIVEMDFNGSTTFNLPSAAGTTRFDLTAPTTPGTYPGEVGCGINGAVFTVSVGGGQGFAGPVDDAVPVADVGATVLPAGGTDATGTISILASGTLLIGGGLFGVARIRRRQDAVGRSGVDPSALT